LNHKTLKKSFGMEAKGQKKTSWREKLHRTQFPKIVNIPDSWARRMGHGKMVILTPLIIDQFINTIPKGKLCTINGIREKFAAIYNADTTCPLTTGIFVWISAGAAEEDKARGMKRITPYWRVVKEDGKLNPKYPGGVKQQARYLEDEGFKISKGKTNSSWRVDGYERFLIDQEPAFQKEVALAERELEEYCV